MSWFSVLICLVSARLHRTIRSSTAGLAPQRVPLKLVTQLTASGQGELGSAAAHNNCNIEQLAMTWLKLWSSSTKDDSKSKEPSKASEAIESATKTLDAASASVQRQTNEVLLSNVNAFAQPQTIIATVILTTASLSLFRFYKSYLRRIPQAVNINPGFFRRRSLVGKVTSVGDGDNFRIYHTPGGRLAGWGWLPGRRIPVEKKELKDQTVCLIQGG